MSEREHTYCWRGAHLFLGVGVYQRSCDSVLLDVLEPFIRRAQAQQWMERWFFVRYGEQGPHIRLRFFGESGRLEERLVPALEATLRERCPSVLIEESSDRTGRPALSRGDTRSGAIHRLAWTAYEPEFARYGGPVGVRLAEDTFQSSSEFALAALEQFRSAERSARLGRSLIASLLTAWVFFGSRRAVAAFAQAYRTGYLNTMASEADRRSKWLTEFDGGYRRQTSSLIAYIEETWERLLGGDPLTDDLDSFRSALIRHRDRFAQLCADNQILVDGAPRPFSYAAARIVPSYVHMTNNRLGVSIPEEAYLAHIVDQALGGGVQASRPASATEDNAR